jgi:hypothetical protein
MTHDIATHWPNLVQGIAEMRAVARMSSFQRALWAAEREPILRERAIAARVRERSINGWLPARGESAVPVALINRVQSAWWKTLDGQLFGPRRWARRPRQSVLVEQLPLPTLPVRITSQRVTIGAGGGGAWVTM